MRRERRNQRAFSAKWALASAVGSLGFLPQAMGGAPGAVENFDIKPIDWKGLDNGGGAGEWGPYGFSATNKNQTSARRQLQISVDVEMIDQVTGKTLWQQKGLMKEGQYEERGEAKGRREAIDRIVTEVIQGAQSQW